MSRGLHRFGIAVVKPERKSVLQKTVKASDRAWKEALFGIGGSKVNLGRARVGTLGGQPLSVIVQRPAEVPDGTAVWTLRTQDGLFAFSGPGAVYGDASFGPAALLVDSDVLLAAIEFDPDPEALAEGLRNTLQKREGQSL